VKNYVFLSSELTVRVNKKGVYKKSNRPNRYIKNRQIRGDARCETGGWKEDLRNKQQTLGNER